MRRRGRAAVILAGAAALIGAVVIVTSGDEPAARRRTVAGDRPLQPTANPSPARGKAGPNVVGNPADEDHIVELHQELATGDCEFNTSRDRGRTWTGGKLQAPPGYPSGAPGPCSTAGLTISNIGQQSVAFGSGSNVYISWASTKLPDADGDTVLLSRSGDGGATFSQAVEVPGMVGGLPPLPNFARPELVVDRRTPSSDRIYVASLDDVATRAMVVRSDDAGTTWTRPVEASRSNPLTNPPPTFASGGATTAAGDAYNQPSELTQPVLGPPAAGGGERPLHLGWVSLNRAAQCPPDCEVAGEVLGDGYLVVATSLDAGQTWARTRAVNVRGFLNPNGAIFRGASFPRLAAAPTGSLYLAFNQGPGTPRSTNCGAGPFPTGAPGAATTPCPAYGDARTFERADHSISYDTDVWFLRSPDGGWTWGGLKQLNDPKRPGLAVTEITQTRHPQVAVAPNGRVDVVWEDRRHWYLSPALRRAAVTPAGRSLAGYRCVHTHAPCEEARLGDTYHSGSSDGGATFTPNRRVNDRSHNNDVGFDFRFSAYKDYGPAAVALGATTLLVADMDSRLGNPASNSLDIFLREVELGPPAPELVVDDVVTAKAPGLSVAFSQRSFPGGPEAVLDGEYVTRPAASVVIVNEGDAAAALVGGVLARAGLGALLASPATGLPAAVKAEVDRLDPVRAYVLGDGRALGPQIQVDLEAAGVPTDRITRISGVTPADQAASVARALDGRSAEEKRLAPPVPAFDAAVIVNPSSSSGPAASALAASRRLPVLHVDRDTIPAATRSALAELGITRTLVVGSAEIVTPGVEASLPDPVRLDGADQYAISSAVVRESMARGLPGNVVYVADGGEPMHAALVGAAVARLGGVLLLAPGGNAAAAQSRLEDLRPVADRLVVSDLTEAAKAAGTPNR